MKYGYLIKPKSTLIFSLFFLSFGLVMSPITVCAADKEIIVHDGSKENSLTKEEAKEKAEQWKETKSLRDKINQQNEKEFDKHDKAIDKEDDCRASSIVTAYWDATTRRCLDSRTGKEIYP